MTRNTEPLTIENVQELLKGITPGPWNVQGAAIQGNRLICAPALNDIAIAQTVPRPWSIAAECADAKLMAAAPDLARLCLSLADQLQKEREARERMGASLKAWELGVRDMEAEGKSRMDCAGSEEAANYISGEIILRAMAELRRQKAWHLADLACAALAAPHAKAEAGS